MGRKPKEYRRTRIIVAGKGHFPTDMLRRDSCVAETSRDSVLIDAYSTLQREIALWRYTLDGGKAQADLWKGFGWTVIFDDGH